MKQIVIYEEDYLTRTLLQEWLSEAGYDGWISIEDLSSPCDPVAAAEHNADVLRALPGSGWHWHDELPRGVN